MRKALLEKLKHVGQPAILVVGDLILDRYIWGEVKRVSPEAPIQILHVSQEENRLGGAANVAHNLRKLGARVDIAGLVGNDQQGRTLRALLNQQDIRAAGVLTDAQRMTTVKSRMIAHSQQLLRIDREVTTPASAHMTAELIAWIEPRLADWQLIVISDYAKGLLTAECVKSLVRMARQQQIPLIAGPKGTDWTHYQGATALSANRSEMELIAGMVLNNEDDYQAAAQRLLAELDLQAVIITLGAQGSYLLQRNGQQKLHRSVAREVFDVTGAGDTVLATLALMIAEGNSWEDAVNLANIAGGLAVAKVGVAPVERQDLYYTLSELHCAWQNHKIRPLEELARILTTAQQAGKTVCLAYGSFSCLTPDDIAYFNYCKQQGDIVIIALLPASLDVPLRQDQSVPWQTQAEMVAAVDLVDYVITSENQDLSALLAQLQPDSMVTRTALAPDEIPTGYNGRIYHYPV